MNDETNHENSTGNSTGKNNENNDTNTSNLLTDFTAKITSKQPFTRRHFLAGLATVLAAACGADDATPTPRPFPTFTATPVARSSLLRPPANARQLYLPYVANGSGALEVAAIPTETSTPPPPPTATPEATPFPPGPPSKLGLVVAYNHPQLFELLATQGVVVVTTLEFDVNFITQIKQTAPRVKLIGRLGSLPQVDLSTLDPLPAARAFLEQLLPLADDPARRPYFDGWQAYNEPVPTSVEEMKRLADFEAERTRLLGERGIRSVIGNFGVGQPGDLTLWPHFFPALQAAKEQDGWLGLHEYSAPTIYYLSTRDKQGRYPGVSSADTGWLTLRYRQVYNQILKPAGLAIPLVFTELGVDGLVANDRPGPANAAGWQDFQQYWSENGYGQGPGAYIEQLVWFDEAMRQDDYVIGGCIFALAGSSGWHSYDILGQAARVLQQYLSVHVGA